MAHLMKTRFFKINLSISELINIHGGDAKSVKTHKKGFRECTLKIKDTL